MTLRKILSNGMIALLLLCGHRVAAQTAEAPKGAPQAAKPAPDNLFAEGYSLLEAGDAQAAATKFEAGLKASPQNPLAHFFLGKAYYTLEKYDLAKSHLEKSLELDPTNKYAANAKTLLQKITEKQEAAFSTSNKDKPGVVTLPSGLQYKILAAGTGPKPSATDTIVCQYRGTHVDGTEFDSSYKRSQPATFQVSGVIKGFGEALQLMPVGSKWQLVIPPNLAYGERGAGNVIGPNETLVFEVELVSIVGKPSDMTNSIPPQPPPQADSAQPQPAGAAAAASPRRPMTARPKPQP